MLRTTSPTIAPARLVGGVSFEIPVWWSALACDRPRCIGSPMWPGACSRGASAAALPSSRACRNDADGTASRRRVSTSSFPRAVRSRCSPPNWSTSVRPAGTSAGNGCSSTRTRHAVDVAPDPVPLKPPDQTRPPGRDAVTWRRPRQRRGCRHPGRARGDQ